jgi:hypothetical protein
LILRIGAARWRGSKSWHGGENEQGYIQREALHESLFILPNF